MKAINPMISKIINQLEMINKKKNYLYQCNNEILLNLLILIS